MESQGFLKYSKRVVVPLYISLEPGMLNQEYKENILSSLKQKYEKKCLSKYGFIHEIKRIVKIQSDEIGSIFPTSNLIAATELTCFLPRINMRFEIRISIILVHGIFCYMDKIRILIPIANLAHWELQKDFTSQKLINKIDHRILKKDDVILIRLEEVRFEKDGYSCIAKLL